MNKETIEKVKRYIFLEEKLKELNLEKVTKENRIKALIEFSFKIHEIFAKEGKYLNILDEEYLTYAYIMPIEEIEKEIERYDNSKPKLDELKFISELVTLYNVEKYKVIRRIQEIRMINRVKQMDSPKQEKQRFSVLAVPCNQALVLPSNEETPNKDNSEIYERARIFEKNNLAKEPKRVQQVKVRKKVVKRK